MLAFYHFGTEQGAPVKKIPLYIGKLYICSILISSPRYICQKISKTYIFDQRIFDKIYWKVIYLTKYIGKLYIWQNILENYIFDLLTVHCRFSRESGPGARTLPKIQSSKKHSLKHKGKCKYKYKTCVCILQNPANPALTCWFLLQVVGRPAKERKWFSAPL